METNIMIKGFNFGFLAQNGYFSSPDACKAVDGMQQLGTKWVAINCTVMQEHYYNLCI